MSDAVMAEAVVDESLIVAVEPMEVCDPPLVASLPEERPAEEPAGAEPEPAKTEPEAPPAEPEKAEPASAEPEAPKAAPEAAPEPAKAEPAKTEPAKANGAPKRKASEPPKKKKRQKSCEPEVAVGGVDVAFANETPVMEPDAMEVRLLSLVDAEGRLLEDCGERMAKLAGHSRLEAATGVSKAVFLVVLRQSGAVQQAQFVEAGGLKPLGSWLVRDDAGEDLALMLLAILKMLPVTKKAIRASDVGRIVKRLKTARPAIAAACSDVMDEWTQNVGNEPVEPSKKKQQLQQQQEPKKKNGVEKDPLASALTKVAPGTTRVERAEARRSGRGGGVQMILEELAEDDELEKAKPKRPVSRPFDPALGNLIERSRGVVDVGVSRKKVRWADEVGNDLEAKKDPEPGWLDAVDDHLDSLSLKDRTKREHEDEKHALELAKREAAAEKERIEQERLDALKAMKATVAWTRPPALDPQNPFADDFPFSSPEAQRVQPQRIDRLMEARYLSARDIPRSPDERDPELLLGPADFTSATLIPLGDEDDAPAPEPEPPVELPAEPPRPQPKSAPSFDTPTAYSSSDAPYGQQPYGAAPYGAAQAEESAPDAEMTLSSLDIDTLTALQNDECVGLFCFVLHVFSQTSLPLRLQSRSKPQLPASEGRRSPGRLDLAPRSRPSQIRARQSGAASGGRSQSSGFSQRGPSDGYGSARYPRASNVSYPRSHSNSSWGGYSRL